MGLAGASGVSTAAMATALCALMTLSHCPLPPLLSAALALMPAARNTLWRNHLPRANGEFGTSTEGEVGTAVEGAKKVGGVAVGVQGDIGVNPGAANLPTGGVEGGSSRQTTSSSSSPSPSLVSVPCGTVPPAVQ